MLSHLNEYFIELTAFAKANPILASAFGLWGLSIITFILKDIPKSFLDFIVYHSTTQLDLNSQDPVYYDLLNWLSTHKLHSWVRTLNLNNAIMPSYYGVSSSKTSNLSIGYGTTLFFHKRRLFSLRRSKVASDASNLVKEVITLKVFGRNQGIFKDIFVESVKKDPLFEDYTKVYTYSDGSWEHSCSQFKRSLDTVALTKANKESLINTIDNFHNSRGWYKDNGVPYRLGILLQGPTGTGKTSLIKAICAKYGRDLYLLNLSTLRDNTLISALASVPERGIIAIEDIDAQGLQLSRERVEQKDKPNLTISGILNGLDGAVSSEDRIIIATTNHPDKLDKALLRAGRMDLILTIDNLDTDTFVEYMSRMYKDFELPEDFVMDHSLSPATLQNLVFVNQKDYTKVLLAISSYNQNKKANGEL